MSDEPEGRRDSRGRRIGHNWWREHCVNVWFGADQAWRAAREVECIGYPADNALYGAYGESHSTPPRPTFKATLVQNAGLAESLKRAA